MRHDTGRRAGVSLTEHHDGVQVEAFVHDLATLRYFIEQLDAKAGSSRLANMVLEGVPVPGLGNGLATEARKIASNCIAAGPPPLDAAAIGRQRYLIDNLLDDLMDDRPQHERLATAATLYVQLAHFVLRASGKFTGEGKGLARSWEAHDPALVARTHSAFATFFETGDATPLAAAVGEALTPHGGRIGPQYFAQAPAYWR